MVLESGHPRSSLLRILCLVRAASGTVSLPHMVEGLRSLLGLCYRGTSPVHEDPVLRT
jgi:hypothetical protein